jgi:uncharacterized protein YkwD
MNKRGMTTVVTSLILILIAIVVLSIVGVVVNNLIRDKSDQFITDQFTTDLVISNVQVLSETEMQVTVKRNPGEGNVVGIAFVAYDFNGSEVVRKNIPLKELEQKNFQIILEVVNASEIQKIAIAPIFGLDSGKELTGEIQYERDVSGEGRVVSSGGSSGGGNSRVYNCGDGTCQDYEDCLTCEVDCGVCYNCSDGLQNGDETGVDCGGSICEPCLSQCQNCIDGGGVWCESPVSSSEENFCSVGRRECVNSFGRRGIPYQTNCPNCSDGIQNQDETEIDCGGPCPDCTYCGDEICSGNENCLNCPLDCGKCFDCDGLLAPPVCGDGICAGNAKGSMGWIGPENCDNCPEDCVCNSCGDGICGPDESCKTRTEGGEIFIPCPQDCSGTLPARCGDGICGTGENCTNCPLDCGECSLFCGDGICDLDSYGNSECETSDPFPDLGAFEHCSEDYAYCPQDCGICTFLCGNDYCDSGESTNAENSCGDCWSNSECGDGYCKIGSESISNCPQDCGTTCTPEIGCSSSERCVDGTCVSHGFNSCDVWDVWLDLEEYPYNKYGQRIVPEGKEITIYFDYWADQEESCDQDVWTFQVCEYNLDDTDGWACDPLYPYVGIPNRYVHPINYFTWKARLSTTCKPSYKTKQEFFISRGLTGSGQNMEADNMRSCTFDWQSGFNYLGTNPETMPSENDPRFFTVAPSYCYGDPVPTTCSQCLNTPGYNWCANARAPAFCTNSLDECKLLNGEFIDVCPTCNDGIQNQGEIDIDCGGAYCPPCNYGTIYCTDSTNDCPYNPDTVYGYLDNLDCVQGVCNECDSSTSGMACTSHEFPWQEGTCAMRPSDDYWICNRWVEVAYDEANDEHLWYCRSDTVGYPCMPSAQGGGDFVQTGYCNEWGDCSLDLSTLDTFEMENSIHDLINQKRIENGLNQINWDSPLAEIARAHSQDMADNDYFSHINLDDLNPQERAELAGYSCPTGIGENIYRHNTIGETFDEIVTSTVEGWMGSPGHREAILNSNFLVEGIGVVVSLDGRIVITENFC